MEEAGAAGGVEEYRGGDEYAGGGGDEGEEGVCGADISVVGVGEFAENRGAREDVQKGSDHVFQ